MVHDIPGYDPDTHGTVITMDNLVDALDGKIADEGNVSIVSFYYKTEGDSTSSAKIECCVRDSSCKYIITLYIVAKV